MGDTMTREEYAEGWREMWERARARILKMEKDVAKPEKGKRGSHEED